jgi:hypothetical protein
MELTIFEFIIAAIGIVIAIVLVIALAEMAAKGGMKSETDICKWHKTKNWFEYMPECQTEASLHYCVDDDSYKSNYTYCPYCGKKIEVE